eukprot:SAG22_NODE_182_length_16036_cov_13.692226_1_plen_183_part_00
MIDLAQIGMLTVAVGGGLHSLPKHWPERVVLPAAALVGAFLGYCIYAASAGKAVGSPNDVRLAAATSTGRSHIQPRAALHAAPSFAPSFASRSTTPSVRTQAVLWPGGPPIPSLRFSVGGHIRVHIHHWLYLLLGATVFHCSGFLARKAPRIHVSVLGFCAGGACAPVLMRSCVPVPSDSRR